MILGDSSLVGGLDVGGGPADLPPPLPAQAGIGTQIPDTQAVGTPVYTGPADQWGLISVPTGPAPDGEAQGDPALWLYLRYLKAFLQTDRRATALWAASGMAPGVPVVNAIRAHEPGDDGAATPGLGLTSKDLPALYMWRRDGGDSSSAEYIAEDWLIETSDVRLLWVFPEMANTAIQRTRQTFINALAKCIVVAIERGRTPSFVVPGDPDPQAAIYGSFVHTFTQVFSMSAVRWGPSRVRITTIGDREGVASATVIRPALEMRFEMQENLVEDPNLWSFGSGLQQTVVEGQPVAPPWAPTALYGSGSFILAAPSGSSVAYVFQAAAAGVSGFGPPVWPIVTGATVGDGSITWTCRGPAPTAYVTVGRA